MRNSRSLRRIVGIGFCLTLFATVPADAGRQSANRHATVAPAIYVGTQKIHVRAFVDRGRVLVPVRGVFEAIGAAVSYTPPHFVVVRKDGAVLAAFILGRTHGIAGQHAVDLDTPAVRRDGRIYVPLRLVAEAAGATVAFTSRPPTIHIAQRPSTSGDRSEPTAATTVDQTPTTAPETSIVHWRVGVAIITALCCLGCLVITARRYAPAIFRPAPGKRARAALESDPAAFVAPPADVVALTSVEATGEARFHKQLVRETRTIEVPVTREELVIEYAGDGGTVIIEGRLLEAGETVRIPLWEERVHVDVTKHVMLNEDIVINKRRMSTSSTTPDSWPEETPDLDLPEGSPS